MAWYRNKDTGVAHKVTNEVQLAIISKMGEMELIKPEDLMESEEIEENTDTQPSEQDQEQAEDQDQEDQEQDQAEDQESQNEIDYLEEMKKDELIDLATSLGIELKSRDTADSIRDKIRKVK